MEPTDVQKAQTIRALLEEKRGYEARGDVASAAGVAVELRLLGHGVKRSELAEDRLNRRGGSADPSDRAETRPRRGGLTRRLGRS